MFLQVDLSSRTLHCLRIKCSRAQSTPWRRFNILILMLPMRICNIFIEIRAAFCIDGLSFGDTFLEMLDGRPAHFSA